MAGLAETRGPPDDNFWTWREVMYRFLDRLTPDDVEAIAAQAYVEMLERGFTRVGEFHYLHHDRGARPTPIRRKWRPRIAAAAARPGIGLTLLPVFYAHGDFRRRAADRRASGASSTTSTAFARLVEACRARSCGRCPTPFSASRRTACAP